MVSIQGNALIGSDLEFVEALFIQVDENGIITELSTEKKSADYVLPSSCVVVPGFINGHTHIADAFIKDQTYGLSLEEAVGSKGIKHSKLNSSLSNEKIQSMRNSLELLVKNGYTTFIDFREEGKQGIKLLKDELRNFPIRGIILGRQNKNEKLSDIFEEADGLGFSDVFSINDKLADEIKLLKESDSKKIVTIHASESMEVISESLTLFGKPDIEKICDYSIFDFVVHATYSNENDLHILKKKNMHVICCPISNLYHGLKFPPINLILKNNVLLGLGTDNVFCCNPDPFRLMAFTLYSARSNYQNLSPKEIIKSITVNLGNIIGRKIGQIREGYSGDLIAINLESPNTKYSKDVYTAITMRADSSDIVFQMFKGEIVKWKDQK